MAEENTSFFGQDVSESDFFRPPDEKEGGNLLTGVVDLINTVGGSLGLPGIGTSSKEVTDARLAEIEKKRKRTLLVGGLATAAVAAIALWRFTRK